MDVFATTLKRSEILSDAKDLDFSHTQSITINIHRNHAFEPIQSVITPFLHYAGLKASFFYGDYDDSLSFTNLTQCSKQADIEIIFLDLYRYQLPKEKLMEFIKERCFALRSLSNAPILVLLLVADPLAQEAKQDTLLQSQNIFILSLNALYATYCELTHTSKAFLDAIKENITGTKLSNPATLALAQILGLRYIPSLVLSNLKAIVLDLDNTLYQGILGEDGKENLLLTPAHKTLQESLLEYKKQGYLLAIASKNEEKDAKTMFESRPDFPLKWSDFDAIKVNWESKANNLIEIAQSFNIGIDSMLFIDDNIAEIESTKYTGVRQIHATTPQNTLFNFFLYPRLYKFRTNKEDAIRSIDIAANAARSSLEALSDEEYFSNLAIELEFRIDLKEDAQRVYELMNKTNQFIANYTRPSMAQVQEWLESKHHCIISIAMRDRLSDSGIIGIIIGERKSTEEINLHAIDITISCRALGRRLESIMLFKAFKLIQDQLNPSQKEILIHYQEGERNAPFLKIIRGLVDSQNIISLPPKCQDVLGLSILVKRNA